MKRWIGTWVLVAFAAAYPILLRSANPALLTDTDTRVLLATLRRVSDPWVWFRGDWPLGNHFYRPIPSLSFWLDQRLWGETAWGYGLTNALIAAAMVGALAWFVRELTDSPAATGLSAGLFSIWLCGSQSGLASWASAWAVLALAGGFFRHGFQIRRYIAAGLVAYYLSVEAFAPSALHGRLLSWLPGRTATTMATFALLAMASYARYERISAARASRPEPGPLDPPATRSAQVAGPPAKRPWGWAVAALALTALALGSYEQAVMLPAALLGVALCMRWQGCRIRWGWAAGFWGLLFGYLALRSQVVPSEASAYQLQQLRDGPGVWLGLSRYVFPPLAHLPSLASMAQDGPGMLLTDGPYVSALLFAAAGTAAYQLRRRWVWAVAGWALSILAYLPMAWLSPFDHYHAWPIALRTLLVVALAYVAKELTAIAWSPPTRQAPPRPTPAPGSLPRR